MLLGELADELGEVVGNRLAQGIVIDRAKRTAEIARTLLPSRAVGRFRAIRVPGMTGSLTLASLLGTQLLVPPRAGSRRASYKSGTTAQRLRVQRTASVHLLDMKKGLAHRFEDITICFAACPAQRRKPNRSCLVPHGRPLLWGAVQASNSRFSRVATIWTRRQRRRKSRFEGEFTPMSLGQELAPHLPFLRRYARALTGSQAHGDAFVRATLEAIVAKPDEFPRDVDPRLGLYKTFHAIWSTANDEEGEEPSRSPVGPEGIAH